MIFPIILFFISFIALWSLIFHRVLQMRSGMISQDLDNSQEHYLIPEVNFHIWKKQLFVFLKKWAHVFILFLIKVLVILNFYLKKIIKIIFNKIGHLFKKYLVSDEEKAKNFSSVFLQTMFEYKEKMKKFRQKIEKEDKELRDK